MGKTKIIEASGTAIEVKISELRITAEDMWLLGYIDQTGGGIMSSPHYLYLRGLYETMYEWMQRRDLMPYYITMPMMDVLQSIIKEGQKEPIKIYKDMRINTGHKRAACMLFLGYKTIKAIIVPDNTKL